MHKSDIDAKWNKRVFKNMNLFDVLCKSNRFDLIFKFLYVKNKSTNCEFFYKNLYLISIKHFNNFYEKAPFKNSSQDFISAFDGLIDSIDNNKFDTSISNITITKKQDLYDGAHRLSILAFKNLNTEIGIVDLEENDYDYKFFLSRSLPDWCADLAALEFVKLSKYAYIATVHSCVDDSKIAKIEDIFKKDNKIYYKKELYLNFNSYVNLKKISYCGDEWVGTVANFFEGAQTHAKKSFGNFSTKVYVIISENISLLNKAKKKIRDYCGNGNYSIHITDEHSKTILLAETLLQASSISVLNVPFTAIDYNNPPDIIKRFKLAILNQKLSLYKFCIVGSYVMDIHGLRKAKDLDFVNLYKEYVTLKENFENFDIENHGIEDDFYYFGTFNQIVDPRCHFYLYGVKFLTLSSLLYYKARRNEKPKDTNDVELIMNYQANYEPKKLFMWNFKKRISIFLSIKIIILELLRKIYRNIFR
jgi:hypothetical protein